MARRRLYRGLSLGVALRQAAGLAAVTLLVALAFGFLSQGALSSLGLVPALFVLVFIVGVGVVFDMVGLATAVAQEKPFHAMAAKKTPGARQALWLIRNADRVTAVFNDLVGDVCGTVSGAVAVAIVFRVLGASSAASAVKLGAVAVVASITVGGKAAGKQLAISRAEQIVHRCGQLLAWWEGQRGGGNRKRKG